MTNSRANKSPVFKQGTLTIAAGVITPAVGETYLLIDTESAASTDDLDTITLTNIKKGALIIVASTAAARDPTIKDGVDNMHTAGDFTLTDSADSITLFYKTGGSLLYEIARSNNT